MAETSNSLLEQARDAALAKQNKAARELLRQLLAAEPRNDAAWELSADVAQNRNDAIDCLGRALRYNPGKASAYEKLAALVGAKKAKQYLPASAAPPIQELGSRPCPNCGKEIQAAAIVCKYCGRDVSPVVRPALNTLSKLIVVLLAILGLFWIGIGLIQITVGLAEAAQNPAGPGIAGLGGLNVILSIVNLFQIRRVIRRERKVVESLVGLGVVGLLWGGWQLLSGGWLQVFVIPVYVSLGVLAWINREHLSAGAKIAPIQSFPSSH